MVATSAACLIWVSESRNLALTSRVSSAPVSSDHAAWRSPKVGIGTSTSSTVRSPSVSAPERVGASSTSRSGCSSIARSSAIRSAGSRRSSPSPHSIRPSSAQHSAASAITSGLERSRTSVSSSGRPAA